MDQNDIWDWTTPPPPQQQQIGRPMETQIKPASAAEPPPVKNPPGLGGMITNVAVSRGVNKGIDSATNGSMGSTLSDWGNTAALKMGIPTSQSGAMASDGTPVISGWGTPALQGTPLGPLGAESAVGAEGAGAVGASELVGPLGIESSLGTEGALGAEGAGMGDAISAAGSDIWAWLASLFEAAATEEAVAAAVV